MLSYYYYTFDNRVLFALVDTRPGTVVECLRVRGRLRGRGLCRLQCGLAELRESAVVVPALTLWRTSETWSWWVSGRKRSADAAWSSSGVACGSAAPWACAAATACWPLSDTWPPRCSSTLGNRVRRAWRRLCRGLPAPAWRSPRCRWAQRRPPSGKRTTDRIPSCCWTVSGMRTPPAASRTWAPDRCWTGVRATCWAWTLWNGENVRINIIDITLYYEITMHLHFFFQTSYHDSNFVPKLLKAGRFIVYSDQ